MGKKKVLVVIDPGHTGSAYNAGAVKGYYESTAVFELSRYEKAELETYGADVLLTRELNENPGLYDRGQMAVKKGKAGGYTGSYEAVIFESNHTNAFNGQACGVTIIRSAHLPKSEVLGRRIADAVVDVMRPVTGITYNRGVTTKTQSNGADWYGVIRGAVSGAASEGQASKGPVQYAYIVEHGFHDNLKECQFLSKSSNLKKIAEAKAGAIADYFGLVKVNDGKAAVSSKEETSRTKEDPGSDSIEIIKDCVPYLVRVNVEDLNIREKPTVRSASKGFTGKGAFTIVKEATGEVDMKGKKSRWGYLKSGRGWICLDYAKKGSLVLPFVIYNDLATMSMSRKQFDTIWFRGKAILYRRRPDEHNGFH